ncbi:hypothetical protein LCI18_007957 [Fusarium solani-melongenae]|uniref:Uncharacterized protein n=1 Tax=Fusarium solani subsp. cucurbitae TaxID=2747967 RepID=A0ACD3Z742_FUSSC|nr:hypothetical protein LCI18_007957 [Fusarium solani-melongenae]
MAASPDVTSITPQGLGLVLIVTLFLTPPSTIVVALRCGIRLKHGVFSKDDVLMLVGWMLFMVVGGVISKGCHYGLGAKDERLNEYLVEKSKLHIWLLQTFHCSSLVFIKASICVTLLRIAVIKTHRIITWVTLTASCISTLIANWDKSAGICSPPIVITSLSYLVSAVAVATDWICAILPGFMLYKAQIKMATKVSISIILGLGVLASIATIVRLPYIKFYADPTDYPCRSSSVFESGTGIIAGSLPSLRRLLKNWVNFDSSHGHSSPNVIPFTGAGKSTVTSKHYLQHEIKYGLGTVGRSSGSVNPSRAGFNYNKEWEQLDDASSNRKIYVAVDMEMQSLERPTTSSRSRTPLSEV